MMKKLCVLLLLMVSLFASAKEYTFSPGDVQAMKQLLGSGNLQPGDAVVLKDGTYHNLEEIHFPGKGVSGKPIVWRAENPGKAVISGKLRLKIYGEYLQLEDLLFYKAWAIGHDMIDFQGEKGVYASYCRMTRCVIDECNDPQKGERPNEGDEYWVGLRGTNNRIDHCYFANKRVGGLVLQVWLSADNHLNNHLIDHNFFGERQPYGGNGAEIIRIGHSWSSQLESRTIVEDNVFFRCSGENEIISVKSCHNVLRRNLFYESAGGLVCRHGHYNVIESNTFIGHNLRGTAGIRIINQGHTVYDNYIKDVQEGDIIDPGHLREMNILAFLGNLPEFDELMGGMDSENVLSMQIAQSKDEFSTNVNINGYDYPLAYLGVLGVVTAAKARDVDPIVMFTACYYKWLKDGNLKRLGKFRTKSPNEGVVKEMSDFLELIHSLRQERGK